MRRKSERNKSKSVVEKKTSDQPPRKTRRQSRRRKRSSSHSSSDDSEDSPLKSVTTEAPPEEATMAPVEEKKPEMNSNSDEDNQEHTIWKVKTSDTSSGEIQKLKICLQRPPTTPERVEKSPRRRRTKASSQSDDAYLTPEEKPAAQSRRRLRRDSPLVNVKTDDNDTPDQDDVTDNNCGKGKLECSPSRTDTQLAESVQDSQFEESQPNAATTNDSMCKLSESADVAKSVDPNTDMSEEQDTSTIIDQSITDKQDITSSQTSQTELNNPTEQQCEKIEQQNKTDSTLQQSTNVDQLCDNKTKSEQNVQLSDENTKQDAISTNLPTTDTAIVEVKQQDILVENPDIKVPEVEEHKSNTEKETKLCDKEISEMYSKSSDNVPSRRQRIPNEASETPTETISICEPEQDNIHTEDKTKKPNDIPDTSKDSEEISENKTVFGEEQQIPEKRFSEEQIITESNSMTSEGQQEVESKSCEQESIVDSKEKQQAVESKSTEEQETNEVIITEEQKNCKDKCEDEKNQISKAFSENTDNAPDVEIKVDEESNNTGVNSTNKPEICEEQILQNAAVELKQTTEDSSTGECSSNQYPKTTNEGEPYSHDISEDTYNFTKNKRKWGKYTACFEYDDRITLDSISKIYPAFKLLNNDEVDMEIGESPKRVKTQKKERDTVLMPTSVTEKEEDVEKEISTIGINRKISIVDDEASKLKPPPSPPKNPVSAILYITNLVRPFTLKQLNELLSRTGKIIENGFWTDKIKSKCYVQYETVEEAEATRNALHGVQWPIGNGKNLIIDYGTPEAMLAAKNAINEPQVPKPVANEVEKPPETVKPDPGKARNIPIREWDLGKVVESRSPSRNKERQSSRSIERKRHSRNKSPSNGEHQSSRKKKREEVQEVKLMDDLFHKTKATPCIYWLPLTPEQIAKKQQQRQQRMAEHKRRMEESRRMERDYGRGVARSRRHGGRYEAD